MNGMFIYRSLLCRIRIHDPSSRQRLHLQLYDFRGIIGVDYWMGPYTGILSNSGYCCCGWSGYPVNIFTSLGFILPAQLINPPGVEGCIINIPAVLVIASITWLLVRGAKESSQVNTIIVIIKLSVILLFITIGVNYINPANYHPFLHYVGAAFLRVRP